MPPSSKLIRAKSPNPKVDEYALPRPGMTKQMHWRCCCGVKNASGHFPQRYIKCGHFWCEYCCDWHSVQGKEGLKVSE